MQFFNSSHETLFYIYIETYKWIIIHLNKPQLIYSRLFFLFWKMFLQLNIVLNKYSIETRVEHD